MAAAGVVTAGVGSMVVGVEDSVVVVSSSVVDVVVVVVVVVVVGTRDIGR